MPLYEQAECLHILLLRERHGLLTLVKYRVLKSFYMLYILDNVKIGNLKRKNRDHKKVPKQDEDVGNLQILLHLRSLFRLHGWHSICYYTICYASSHY